MHVIVHVLCVQSVCVWMSERVSEAMPKSCIELIGGSGRQSTLRERLVFCGCSCV